MNPLVSIITTTKNADRYLEDCIESVIGQDYQNIEHVFVDGGSTDSTIAILERFEKLYPKRIKVIRQIDNNACLAWVRGMRESKGEILGWLGGDDTFKPNAIKGAVEYFNKTDAKFVFGDGDVIKENGEVISHITAKPFDLGKALRGQWTLFFASAFYKREVLDNVNPDICVKPNCELAWWIAIGKKYRLEHIPITLSNFRVYKDKKQKDGFYIYAKTVYQAGRANGMSAFSLGSLFYYLTYVLRPLSFIIDPIFLAMVRR